MLPSIRRQKATQNSRSPDFLGAGFHDYSSRTRDRVPGFDDHAGRGLGANQRSTDVENLPSKAGKVGSQKQLFNGKTAMLDSFECHTSTVNAGQEVHGPQPQFEEELIIVREGTVQTVVDGKTVRVSPGSVIFAASNDPHGVKNVGETPATYYVIKWTAGGATAGK
jgi:XRE family transcriptional regulator, regulator of sulfur utilization